MHRHLLSCAVAIFVLPSLLNAQRLISGVVVDSAGHTLSQVLIVIRTGNDTVRTTSDAVGEFRATVRSGDVALRVTRLGFRPLEEAMTDTQLASRLRLVLVTTSASIEGVIVQGQSTIAELRKSPLTVSALDAHSTTLQTRSTADALDRVAGVRVRQSGGDGSDALVSIDGLSGSQIRTFVNGLPQDFLGPAGQLTALSVATLDRVEVYKGVVPSQLGGDALGGAINVVTDTRGGNFGTINVGAGSFGRRNVDGAVQKGDSRRSAGVSVSYLETRNDYRVDVTTLDANYQATPYRATRFHDGFRSTGVSANLALLQRRLADTLRLRVFGAADKRELQNAPIMAQPYGQATLAGSAVGSILTWHAASLFDARADVGYSRVSSLFVDTTLNVYDWNGSVIRRRDYGGEISGTRNLLHLGTDNIFARASVGHDVLGGMLQLHAMHFSVRRAGHDSIAAEYYGVDPFRQPSTLVRTVFGIEYTRDMLKPDVRYILAFKHYLYSAKGAVLQQSSSTYVPAPAERRERSGVLAAMAWHLSPSLTAKTSYEIATRLPDVDEVLGDFALSRPNPRLKPETSRNFNSGISLSRSSINVDLDGFSRSTTDIVFLEVSQFFALHENLLAAHTIGASAALSAHPLSAITFDLSTTYQDIRNRSPKGASTTVADRYFNAPLPNIPAFFANAQLSFSAKGLNIGTAHTARSGSRQLWWTTSYVHEFFLHWAVDGLRDSKAVIPTQLVHSIGASQPFHDDRFALSIELQNAFNSRAYDVFSVPRPGRAVQLHLRSRL